MRIGNLPGAAPPLIGSIRETPPTVERTAEDPMPLLAVTVFGASFSGRELAVAAAAVVVVVLVAALIVRRRRRG